VLVERAVQAGGDQRAVLGLLAGAIAGVGHPLLDLPGLDPRV